MTVTKTHILFGSLPSYRNSRQLAVPHLYEIDSVGKKLCRTRANPTSSMNTLIVEANLYCLKHTGANMEPYEAKQVERNDGSTHET